jgi:hypothetical protein
VRALDALQFAPCECLRTQNLDVHPASYDERLIATAKQ